MKLNARAVRFHLYYVRDYECKTTLQTKSARVNVLEFKFYRGFVHSPNVCVQLAGENGGLLV